MPVFLAICDIVADRSPCSATSAAVVSRIASQTAARCASIVSFHRFGTTSVYTTSLVRQSVFTKTYCLDKLLLSSITHEWKDTRMAGSPPYPHPHHGSTAPIGPEDLYTSQPPWDIGRPQPAFLALADAGAIRGRTARFLLQDARHLADLGESFDTVLDCGLFHIFNDDDRAAFVDSLRYVLPPGGRYFMLCFSDQQPGDWGPHRVTRDEITASFTDGWRIDSIEPSTIDITTDPAGIRAWLVALTRIPTSANPLNTRAALIGAHKGAHPSGEDRKGVRC